MLLMGKSTISTGPFSIAMLNNQRVYFMGRSWDIWTLIWNILKEY
jgi:hypothetical protein